MNLRPGWRELIKISHFHTQSNDHWIYFVCFAISAQARFLSIEIEFTITMTSDNPFYRKQYSTSSAPPSARCRLWVGVFASAGVPEERMRVLEQAIDRVMSSKEIQRLL